MKKEKKVWAITLIAFWWLAPNLLQAQQDSIRSTNLSEVVVTATKFPKNVNETAKVLTIIDEEQLARSSGKDVSQLLNEQVGLVINGANSNPAKDKSVFLRGAGSGYTLILLDGIPVNDPSGVGGAFDLRLLPVDQIERIEILKGSQSTLYGTDAIAGVINIITKKKVDKPMEFSETFSGGSYGTRKSNFGITGGTGLVDYNFSFTNYKTDGISEAYDKTGTGDFDADGYNQDAFQANVNFRISEALSIKPYFRYNNFNGKYDEDAFTDSKNNNYTSNILNTGLTATYKFSKGAFNLLYGYDKTDRRFDADFYNSIYKGRFHHVEGFFNYDLSDHVQVLAGASYQNIHMLDTTAVEKNPDVTIASPYASFFLKNMGGFSLELGGRLNSHSKYGNNYTYSLNPSYLVNRQVKVFANISTGFKTPTLSQLFGQYGPNPDLKPEKSQNLEAGVQFFSTNKKFDARVSAFQREITDVIVSNGATSFKYTNRDKQNDNGFEIELSERISPLLTLQGYYAYVDGNVAFKTPGGTDTTYNNLIRRPKHTFGLKLGFQVTPRLFAQANLKTFSNRTDSYSYFDTVIFKFVTTTVNLDAYQLLDLYLEYKIGKGNFKVFVDVKNLLNQDYMEVYGYNTLKFNVMSGLNFKF